MENEIYREIEQPPTTKLSKLPKRKKIAFLSCESLGYLLTQLARVVLVSFFNKKFVHLLQRIDDQRKCLLVKRLVALSNKRKLCCFQKGTSLVHQKSEKQSCMGSFSSLLEKVFFVLRRVKLQTIARRKAESVWRSSNQPKRCLKQCLQRIVNLLPYQKKRKQC